MSSDPVYGDMPTLPVGKIPPSLLHSLISDPANLDDSVIVGPGIGRDAAVVDLDGMLLVLKTDPVTIASTRMSQYLINVNANDLACLGARPRWMLVTSLLPENQTTAQSVRELFESLQSECRLRGIALVGGHSEITAGIDRPILVGTLIGVTTKERLISPGQGLPGDRLVLTRPIAIEGTALLANERAEYLAAEVGHDIVSTASSLLDDPGISVVEHADVLLETGGVSALHDPTEGGLATGLREIGEVSGCGVVVDRSLIPVMESTDIIARSLGIDPLGMLASGSLLAAVRPDAMEAISNACQAAGIDCAVIGKLTPNELGFTMLDNGLQSALPQFETDEVSRALILTDSEQAPCEHRS